MCGIAGYILKKPCSFNNAQMELLINPIRQRGPNDEGIHLINRLNTIRYPYRTQNSSIELPASYPLINSKNAIMHDVAFFHTRYSIIDLTEKAHQPFISSDQTIIAAFNGEIYNFLELKAELQQNGVVFKTKSDTEVLVEGYRYWGNHFWTKANGFWAVVLYDKKTNEIIFSRDRIGVAPLYYRNTEQGVFFASCLKSLINISPHNLTIDDNVTIGYIQTGIKDHDQSTFYKEIKSVPAGSTITLNPKDFSLQPQFAESFWSLPKQRLNENIISFDEAAKQFKNLFFNAVELRLRSDVPIAFELSGGLDSSSIVAAAAILNKKPLTTYTCKIANEDEEPIARTMKSRYKLNYKVISKIEDHFASDYVSFTQLMEEPFDNPNAYTHHHMLRQMKADGFDVVITGAGGDEVLAGYESSFWPAAYRQLRSGNTSQKWHADWHETCRRFRSWRNIKQTFSHYANMPFSFLNKIPPAIFFTPRQTTATLYQWEYPRLNFHEQTKFHFNTALIPYYMRSSDHFTMSIPIEHRFPLLDYRLIEFGLQMPPTYLFKNGWTKYLLRKMMEPYLPKTIVWRRDKMGFRFPYALYLKKFQNVFSPILEETNQLDPRLEELNNYNELLKINPVMLWRLLSVLIWHRHVVCANQE